MQNKQQQKLSTIKFVFGIMDEYEDCTYCHALVYSYLLCKYNWFKKQNSTFFESQERIAESCRSKYGSVRVSVKWLESKGLLEITKSHSGQHNRNVYVVHDRYNAYKDNTAKENKNCNSFIDEDDESLPF